MGGHTHTRLSPEALGLGFTACAQGQVFGVNSAVSLPQLSALRGLEPLLLAGRAQVNGAEEQQLIYVSLSRQQPRAESRRADSPPPPSAEQYF